MGAKPEALSCQKNITNMYKNKEHLILTLLNSAGNGKLNNKNLPSYGM
jgi:hypothetical protein